MLFIISDYAMDERWTTIAIRRDVYKKLLGMKHDIETENNKSFSFSNVIDFLLSQRDK